MATTRTPRIPSEWKQMAEEKGITSLSIHNEELPSASKIILRHFLLFRVLWKEIQPANFKPAKFGLDRYIQQAEEMLKGYRSWNLYCASFDSSETEEGNFFLAKLFQEDAEKVESNDVGANIVMSPISKCTRGKTREKDGAKDASKDSAKSTGDNTYATPTKSNWTDRMESLHLDDESQMIEDFSGDSPWSPWNMMKKDTPGSQEWNETKPKSQDEQIVNTALINFLKAITAHFPVSSDWSIHRKALAAKFASTEYEAKLDGYLKGKVHGEVRGLIEVKSAARKQDPFEVRMQESAQMVAWLLDSPEIPRRLPGR